MDFSILLFFALLLIFLVYVISSGTILSVASLGTNVWALLFYKEFLLIIPAVLIVQYAGVGGLPIFGLVDGASVFPISLIVLYSVFAFFFCFRLLNTLLIRIRPCCVARDQLLHPRFRQEIHFFALSAVLTGVIVLVCGFLFFDYRHAFIWALFQDGSLLEIRLFNKYHSGFPSQLNYIIQIAFWICAVYSGFLLVSGSWIGAFAISLLGIFIGTADGAKAPVIEFFVILVVSNLEFRGSRPLRGLLLFVIFSLPLLGVLVFYIVKLQDPDVDLAGFEGYLIERLGVGQMQGVYEALSLSFGSDAFIWHAVPFASLFVDYPVFSKELMLYTENAEFSQTGVKNSLFIAEAYGIGGWGLLAVSPFILAFGYYIKYFVLKASLGILFSRHVACIFAMPLLFLTSNLTGDFSSWLFQKGLIFLVLCFLPICFVHLLLRLLVPIRFLFARRR